MDLIAIKAVLSAVRLQVPDEHVRECNAGHKSLRKVSELPGLAGSDVGSYVGQSLYKFKTNNGLGVGMVGMKNRKNFMHMTSYDSIGKDGGKQGPDL